MGWLRVFHHESLPWGNLLIATSPFGLVATAGLRLRLRRREGWILSLAAQLIQVCWWSARGIVWRFCAGGYLYLVLNSQRSTASAGLDATLFVGSGATGQVPTLGVNLVPIGVVFLLFYCRRRRCVQGPAGQSGSPGRVEQLLRGDCR